MALAVAQNVSGVVITSSPGPTSAARSESSRAAVHELTATACAAPVKAANRCSNSATRGPVVSHPERSTASTAATSASVRSGGENGTERVLVDTRIDVS